MDSGVRRDDHLHAAFRRDKVVVLPYHNGKIHPPFPLHDKQTR
jgi:hypothetical protein